jgi:hypothetical protein
MTDTSGTAPPLPPAAGSRYATLQPRAAPDVATDILRGADEIAQFLFRSKTYRRRSTISLAASSSRYSGWAPACARKSVLLQWIEAQERAPK